LYVFGGLLVVAAVKLLHEPEEKTENRLLVWLSRHLPWSKTLDGHHFFTRKNGRWLGTPLLLALIAIELTDVVFAIDSVPAAFAVTEEPFLIYSSNLLAILGLRALYIVLAGLLAELKYLRFGLSAVLAFAGAKLLLSSWVHIPPLVSVGVIAACIAIAVLASLRARVTESGGDTSSDNVVDRVDGVQQQGEASAARGGHAGGG
jgi:tellurite resistance protein TerC